MIAYSARRGSHAQKLFRRLGRRPGYDPITRKPRRRSRHRSHRHRSHRLRRDRVTLRSPTRLHRVPLHRLRRETEAGLALKGQAGRDRCGLACAAAASGGRRVRACAPENPHSSAKHATRTASSARLPATLASLLPEDQPGITVVAATQSFSKSLVNTAGALGTAPKWPANWRGPITSSRKSIAM